MSPFLCINPITSRLDLTLYSAVDKDLRVETSCITVFELLLRVLLGSNFAVRLEHSMSLYQITKCSVADVAKHGHEGIS